MLLQSIGSLHSCCHCPAPQQLGVSEIVRGRWVESARGLWRRVACWAFIFKELEVLLGTT